MLVSRVAGPRSHTRVVHAELTSGHGTGVLSRVLKLARRPHDESRAERRCVRPVGASGGHMHVEGAIYSLDLEHLGAQPHVELRVHSQRVQVLCILRARRVLRVQRERGRRAVGDGVEIERAGPALLVERRRDEPHLFRPRSVVVVVVVMVVVVV
eukprot:scaffold11390_cov64-Phaeocystis_antarctica.AAC.1